MQVHLNSFPDKRLVGRSSEEVLKETCIELGFSKFHGNTWRSCLREAGYIIDCNRVIQKKGQDKHEKKSKKKAKTSINEEKQQDKDKDKSTVPVELAGQKHSRLISCLISLFISIL